MSSNLILPASLGAGTSFALFAYPGLLASEANKAQLKPVLGNSLMMGGLGLVGATAAMATAGDDGNPIGVAASIGAATLIVGALECY